MCIEVTDNELLGMHIKKTNDIRFVWLATFLSCGSWKMISPVIILGMWTLTLDLFLKWRLMVGKVVGCSTGCEEMYVSFLVLLSYALLWIHFSTSVSIFGIRNSFSLLWLSLWLWLSLMSHFIISLIMPQSMKLNYKNQD